MYLVDTVISCHCVLRLSDSDIGLGYDRERVGYRCQNQRTVSLAVITL